MRILIATDAWHPQVNGVVRTYSRLVKEIEKLGGVVEIITPSQFFTMPCPTYPEIQLALLGTGAVAKRVEAFRPHFIHIATEGPIGLMTRAYCRKAGHTFTTSYHTRFPEYVAARFPIPESWCYAIQRKFHNGGSGMMVATLSLEQELQKKGFNNILHWSRGVDTEQFHPRPIRLFGNEPVFLYVGRVAVEKNIEAFLQAKLPGQKVVVGGGPQLSDLRTIYPDIQFTGPKTGEELAQHYASADVFVFPSLTDTFGIVIIEALASGLPIAAFPVTGPKDIVIEGKTGVLDDDLSQAAIGALELESDVCYEAAQVYNWQNSAQQFIYNIQNMSSESCESLVKSSSKNESNNNRH
ncbi:MAG: glycosyltransferase family 1 protein [Pseudomonadota bacterium]